MKNLIDKLIYVHNHEIFQIFKLYYIFQLFIISIIFFNDIVNG